MSLFVSVILNVLGTFTHHRKKSGSLEDCGVSSDFMKIGCWIRERTRLTALETYHFHVTALFDSSWLVSTGVIVAWL